MEGRVALYPGSFDPPTYGHLDLIRRASKIFDKLIVSVAVNRAKTSLFSVEERMDMLELITQDMPQVTVTSFEGLTAAYARFVNASALVRGLRAISDFEFELSMAITNQKVNPEIDTVCLMPSEPYLFLSSNVVREIARFDGDIEEFVPPEIAVRLRRKIKGH
jgi:pantetheine-phosphate adenylyltransferase